MKSIETEEEYNQAIKRLDEIFDAKNNTPEGDELDELISVINEYEDKHFQIDEPEPKEAIKFRKEQEQMNELNKSLRNTVIFVGDNKKLREGVIEYYQENGFMFHIVNSHEEYIGTSDFYINSYSIGEVFEDSKKVITLPHDTFFSPVQGGQKHGYTFLQFISSPQRWGTLLVSLLFIALTLNVGQKESFEIIAIPLAFISLIFFGLIFLHLRKWNDLKNHKSR